MKALLITLLFMLTAFSLNANPEKEFTDEELFKAIEIEVFEPILKGYCLEARDKIGKYDEKSFNPSYYEPVQKLCFVARDLYVSANRFEKRYGSEAWTSVEPIVLTLFEQLVIKISWVETSKVTLGDPRIQQAFDSITDKFNSLGGDSSEVIKSTTKIE